MFEKIEPKKFFPSENGFVYQDEYHSFDEIKHLFFRWVHVIQKLNFTKVGEADRAELVVTLLNNKNLRISIDESGWLFGFNKNKQADLNNLKDFYLYLAQQSFQARLSYYRKEIEEKGYFEYDGCKFYPANKIVFRDIAFSMDTSDLLVGQGYVEMRKKHRTSWDKVKRKLPLTKIPRFFTNTDTDIIFFLLEKLFGRRLST